MPNACIDCRFFCALETPRDAEDKVYGECRRHPPSLTGDFPEVYTDTWCGEFVARLASEPLSVRSNPLSSEPAKGEPTS